MKAISLRQPWAHAVVHLGKRVENRDWQGCAYRGPVLLHASSRVVLRPTKREPQTFGDAVEQILDIVKPAPGDERLKLLEPFAFMSVPMTGKHHGEGLWRPAPTLPLGGIVGRANIIGAISRDPDGTERRSADSTEGRRACNEARLSPWYAGGFALVLADVEPLPFIPWKGSLGFFDVPDDVVLKAIERQGFPLRETVIAKADVLLANPQILGGPR